MQPCQNFGSSFEGACAYGRLATALIIGTAIAFRVFAWLGYRVLSQRSKDSTGVGELAQPPVGWWLFSLLPFAWILLGGDRWLRIPGPLDIVLLAFFVACSTVMLHRCGASRWWVLLGLLSQHGKVLLIAVVCWYLGQRSERKARASSYIEQDAPTDSAQGVAR
ncbi:hypothetical protein [Inhella proteolytica]|uniref:hypothetical protein n=1 Tax=Inhella proteolytica TaxID=2795029 RepID=UPI0018DB89B6|nr:hypothetical protein [Inhella proteolytica]